MLRLLISKNLAILPKSFATLTNTNTVSCLTNCFVQAPNVLGNLRSFSLTNTRYCESYEEKGEGESEARIDTSDINNGQKVHRLYKKLVGTSRDRTKTIPYEKSIEYLKSGAYKATYGDHKVWELYRRVHKGQLPKLLTRKTCIRSKVVITGSPCPICRDEYLILHHNNLELLKQFISPYTGEVRTLSNISSVISSTITFFCSFL